MNNQNYVYPDADSGFHISLPKDQSNVPLAFQNSNAVDMNFAAHNYQTTDGSYFPHGNSHLMAMERNGNITTEHLQASVNDSTVAPRGSESACSMFNDGMMDKGNALVFPNTKQSTEMSHHNSQQFFPKFAPEANDSSSSLPFTHGLTAPQPEPFLGAVSQHPDFPNQFRAEDFPCNSDVYTSNPPHLLEGVAINNQQPQNRNIGEFSNTERFVDSNIVPETLYSQVNIHPQTETGLFCGDASSVHSSYTESPVHSVAQFTDANVSSLTTQCVPEVALSCVAPLHLELSHSSLTSGSKTEMSSTDSQSIRPSEVKETLIDMCLDLECPQNIVTDCDSLPEQDSLRKDAETNQETLCEDAALFPQKTGSIKKPEDYQNLLSTTEHAFLDGTNGAIEVLEDVSSVSGITSSEPVTSCDKGPIPCNTDCNNKTEVEAKPQKESKDLEKEPVPKPDSEGPTEDVLVEGDAAFSHPKIDQTKSEDVSSQETSKSNEETPIDKDEEGKPLSPMITVMNDTFGEETLEGPSDSQEGSVEKLQNEEADKGIRITRARTGTLRKTQRFVDEIITNEANNSSQDSIQIEDWECEESAVLAPSQVDPSIAVPDKVLQVTQEELSYYHRHFSSGVGSVLKMRLDCTTCGKHIGSAPKDIHSGNRHKVLRVLVCKGCQSFYGVGKFDRDSDGSELYCRWCGQGGQVICCSNCPNVFCEPCITRNFGGSELTSIARLNEWACFICNYEELWRHRAICWALLTYAMRKKRDALGSKDAKKILELEEDQSKCCSTIRNKKKKHSSQSQLMSKHATDAASSHTSNLSEMTSLDDGVHFGHFLSDGSTFENILAEASQEETALEDDDYIDLSQFVQPVLREGQERPERQAALPRAQPASLSSPHHSPSSVRPIRPTVNRTQAFQVRLNSPQPTLASSSVPRIIIRQGNLMQPGLVPFNSQPNSITGTSLGSAVRSGMVVSKSPPSLVPSLSSRPVLRNPASLLNNLDGVRSMDQIQSLNQAPWFRDGIDNIRAVGVALNKRIRELEARFHSLKNKQDVEKVINLGKKLDRLTQKTERRFKEINISIKEASKQWYVRRIGNINSRLYQAHPFSFYKECPSDWDDDAELLKPLEKIMIPVSSAVLQNTAPRPPSVQHCETPRIIRNTVRPSRDPAITTQRAVNPAVLQIRQRMSTISTTKVYPPKRTVFSSNAQGTFKRIRLPGPKSSAIRYKQIPSTTVLKHNNVEGVGAFLNMRNGSNSISVSIAPPLKRKRADSNSTDSDSSDVVVCPTIPELLALHKIKPCKVMLEKADDFIVSFLENQEKERNQTIESCNDPLLDCDVECTDSFVPEVETVVVPCDVFADVSSNIPDVEEVDVPCDMLRGNDIASVAGDDPNEPSCDIFEMINTTGQEDTDNDDDIEIIEEINQPS